MQDHAHIFWAASTHTSDAMIDCVPETTRHDLDSVHFFAEYHGRAEQDYGKIAKG